MKSLALIIGIPLGIIILVVTIATGVFFIWGATTSINSVRERGELQQHSYELQGQVFKQLHIGMSEEEVDMIAGEVAWRHYQCAFEGFGWQQDVYIFGSHDLDLAAMLILDYEIGNGKTTLTRIGTFEMYMLDGVVNSDCIMKDIR